MKLGEFFIRKGIINHAQLEQALRAQLIFGGHLGTCLMELGYVEEATLGEILAEIFSVGYAPPVLFENVPRTVIDLMTPRLVEKHHAVPFEHASRTLHVAMIDPRVLPALDEISFATGCKIRPWVAPEARIFQVMERYYDIPRRQRYIAVCQSMDGGQPGSRRSGSGAAGPLPRVASAYASSPYQAELAQISQPAPAPLLPPIQVSAPPPEEAYEEEGGPPPAGPPPGAPPRSSVGEAFSSRLCDAETIEDLSHCALTAATRGLERCALFLVKSTTATLWCCRGIEWDQERRRALTLSVTADPLFELLLERDHYRGPAPEDVGLRASFKAMPLEVPSELLLVPGYVEDRLVIVLYGDGGVSGAIRGKTADYSTFIKKLAYALHLVMLKRKIRSLDLRPPLAGPTRAA